MARFKMEASNGLLSNSGKTVIISIRIAQKCGNKDTLNVFVFNDRPKNKKAKFYGIEFSFTRLKNDRLGGHRF